MYELLCEANVLYGVWLVLLSANVCLSCTHFSENKSEDLSGDILGHHICRGIPAQWNMDFRVCLESLFWVKGGFDCALNVIKVPWWKGLFKCSASKMSWGEALWGDCVLSEEFYSIFSRCLVYWWRVMSLRLVAVTQKDVYTW